MIQIHAVPPEMARQMGAFLKPLIQKACSRGADKTPDDLIENCAKPLDDPERNQLWCFTKGKTPVGVAVTSVVSDAGERCVQVIVVGGYRANDWLRQVVKRGHEFCKAENAACLRFEGRKGWGRVLGLEPLGFTMNGHWIFKDYDNGR